MGRRAEYTRETAETRVTARVDLDGEGTCRIDTTIPFFDHMLTLFCRHGFFDIEIGARGDTEVDFHHTVEDVGLTLGEAVRRALGRREGIARYAESSVPMDEALATATVDLCTRPYLVYNVTAPPASRGDFTVDLAEQFFRALVHSLQATIHLNLRYGSNLHHVLEALFKAFGRALAAAAAHDGRLKGALSTKGRL